MTAHTAATAATAVPTARARTGGPGDDGPEILEHVMGWTLVVVIAMLVVQLGLL
ncbi:SCO1431 family membrane protein [Streptomyces sp. NPDC057245]|uniref:SCO1431 family membrane protein n=1 Tax=Streptomyces TaxID=1883 RepID=UPI001C1E1707|nr:SCO1431 family membrane protein [Streptomyces sp. A108]MBU6533203.1 SCO1431 family membrane protein [Streptomyces sp. A108]